MVLKLSDQVIRGALSAAENSIHRTRHFEFCSIGMPDRIHAYGLTLLERILRLPLVFSRGVSRWEIYQAMDLPHGAHSKYLSLVLDKSRFCCVLSCSGAFVLRDCYPKFI